MAHLIDIFLQPSKVFVDLKERPTFLVPLLLLAGASVAMTLAYFLQVDGAWFTDQQIAASGREMTAKEAAQMRAMMPGPQILGAIGAVGAVITIALMAVLMAVYYLVAGKVTGHAIGFRRGLSLMAWTGMPAVLGIVVALVGIATMTPQTPLESLMLTNVDPLLVQLPVDHKWNRVAESFSLLNLWSIGLAALGWRVWTRSSWLQALVVVLLPSLLIYGALVLWALSR